MGRHPKEVLAPDGTDRRETGFYRTPEPVAAYVARRLLTRRPGLRGVVDPCVGDGAFLLPLVGPGRLLRGMDVDERPMPSGVTFARQDFLKAYARWLEAGPSGRALGASTDGPSPWPEDAWVLNPPYNCHEVDYIREQRSWLGPLFKDLGLHNLYSLFLAASVDMARPGALLAVLVQDSLLTARAHAPLRRLLFSSCAIHELLLCPTDLFRDQGADVRTCLLLLEKGGRQGRVGVLDRPVDSLEFRRALEAGGLVRLPLGDIVLAGPRDHGELLVGVPPQVRAMFDGPRLGERFPTITGISTGQDGRFLRSFPVPGHSVPFYKNPGRRKFWCPPDAYLPDDYLRIAADTPSFQVRNRALMLAEGLVCSSMGVPFGACLRPPGTTFGVNANVVCGKDRWWLLGYLNSSLVTFSVRGVLRRSNMVTAGYVARLPLPPLSSEARRRLGGKARRAWERRPEPRDLAPVISDLDAILAEDLELSPETQTHIKSFARDLIRRT